MRGTIKNSSDKRLVWIMKNHNRKSSIMGMINHNQKWPFGYEKS